MELPYYRSALNISCRVALGEKSGGTPGPQSALGYTEFNRPLSTSTGQPSLGIVYIVIHSDCIS